VYEFLHFLFRIAIHFDFPAHLLSNASFQSLCHAGLRVAFVAMQVFYLREGFPGDSGLA